MILGVLPEWMHIVALADLIIECFSPVVMINDTCDIEFLQIFTMCDHLNLYHFSCFIKCDIGPKWWRGASGASSSEHMTTVAAW